MTLMLNTELYRLRAPEPEDVDIIYRWENDPEDWNSSYNNYAPLSRLQIEEHIRNCCNDPFGERQLRLMMERKDTAEVVGGVEITELNPKNRTAFIGFYVDPKWRGIGIGTLMVSLVLNYCSELLGLRSLCAHTSASNGGAIKILQSNGFRPAGRLSSWLQDGRDRKDMLIFQISYPTDASDA